MKRFKFRNKEYVLDRDAHCFTIYKPNWNVKKDKEDLVAQAFFTELDRAIHWLFNQHVLDKAETKSLIECIKETKQELKELLNE